MIKETALAKAKLINEIHEQLVKGIPIEHRQGLMEMAERLVNSAETKEEWDRQSQAAAQYYPSRINPRDYQTATGVSINERSNGSYTTGVVDSRNPAISNESFNGGAFPMSYNPGNRWFSEGGVFPTPDGGSTENG